MNRYEVYLYETRTHLVTYEVLATKQENAIKKAIASHKTNIPIEDQLVDVEAGKILRCYLVETKVKMPSKKKKPKNVTRNGDDAYYYSHVACPGYPNCDLSPMGCRLLMGDDVEEYGMRD